MFNDRTNGIQFAGSSYNLNGLLSFDTHTHEIYISYL